MSTNAHKDGAKMYRKARKQIAREKAFMFSDGTMMTHKERRWLQKRAIASRTPEKLYTPQRSSGKFSPRAVYDEAMQRNPVIMDALHKSETAEHVGTLPDGMIISVPRTKNPPVVDPLRSERAKRAAATRKLNNERASFVEELTPK